MSLFDLTTVQATSDFDLIPNGEYPAFIDKAEWKTSKAGVDYLSVMFKIVGEKCENRVVFHSFNLFHDKDNVKNIALSDLKKLLMAGGYSENALKFSSKEDLVAKLLEVRCTIKVASRKQEGYSDQNVVKGYRPLENMSAASSSDIPF